MFRKICFEHPLPVKTASFASKVWPCSWSVQGGIKILVTTYIFQFIKGRRQKKLVVLGGAPFAFIQNILQVYSQFLLYSWVIEIICHTYGMDRA